MNAKQVAGLYQEFTKTEVYKHLEASIKSEADSVRRNASKSQDTAYGDLRFADGVEWVLDHIKQQEVLDKIK